MCRFVSHHAGVVVAQVDFRLAPEHPVPAQLNDVYDAYRWASLSFLLECRTMLSSAVLP